MAAVFIRCYEELNDYLPKELKKTTFQREIPVGWTVSDLIDSLGIPAGEIDLILVNDKSVGISQALKGKDRISLYPVFETFDISPLARLPHAPLRKPAFICDAGLGSLAGYLQKAGWDARYAEKADAGALIELSNAQRRIILTTDRRILKEKGVTRVILLDEASSAREQLETVLSFLRLTLPGHNQNSQAYKSQSHR